MRKLSGIFVCLEMCLLMAKLNPRKGGKNGSQRKWGCLLLEASLVIFVLQRACDRESQDTEERVGREPASPFSPIHYLCSAALIR